MVMQNTKPMEEWAAEDFKAEAVKVTGETDPDSDEVLCATMMLAAIKIGAHLRDLTTFLGVKRGRLTPFFLRLVNDKVFTRSGKIACDWFEDGTDISFLCDVSVGLGLMKRATV